MFKSWRQHRGKKRPRRTPSTHISTVQMALEHLEGRTLMAVWNGMGSNSNWTTGENWVGGIAPKPGDDLVFPQEARQFTTFNDFENGTEFNSVVLSLPFSSGYALLGNPFALGPGGLRQSGSFGNNLISAEVILSADRTITVEAGFLTMGGTIRGPGGLTKAGGGTLSFSDSTPNSYQGLTAVNEGQLELRKSRNVTAVPGSLVVGNGVAGGATVSVRDGEQIADDAAVTIRSNGFLQLGGFYASSFSETIGSLTMTGGTISAFTGNALRLGGNVTAASGPFGPAQIRAELDLGLATRIFTILAGGPGEGLTLSGPIRGNPGVGLTKTGPGSLAFDGFNDNTYTGPTRVNEGTLFLSGFGSTRAIPGALIIGDDQGGPGAARVRIGRNDAIADNAPVTINSSGQLEFNGLYSSSFSDTIGSLTMTGGQVDTREGTLRLNGTVTAAPAGALAAVINGNLSLGAATRTFNIQRTVPQEIGLAINAAILGEGAAGLAKTGDGTLALGGSRSNTYVGTTQVREGGLELRKSAGATAIAGSLVVGDGQGTPNQPDRVRISAADQIADEAAVTVTLSGQLEFQGMYAQSFAESIGSLTMTGGRVLTDIHTLRLNGDLTTHSAPVTATISGNLALAAGNHLFNLDRGGAQLDLQVNATVSGDGGLTKGGPGVLMLAGTNTLTGNTRVDAGLLVNAGTHATSHISVGSNGTLAGTGQIGDFVASGTVSPGFNGTSQFRTGRGDFSFGGSLRVELNGPNPGSGYDQLISSSVINGDGATLLVSVGFAPTVGQQFRIIQTNNVVPRAFRGLPNNTVFAAGGFAFRIQYDNQGVLLTRVQAATTTLVVAQENPTVFGQPVTFTALVSSNVTGTPQPRGLVQFLDDDTVLGTAPVNAAGEATFTARTPLPVGTRMIRARYQGATDFEASTSAPIKQEVQQAATVTFAPISFANPAVFGQAVTFLSIINVVAPGAGMPTGTVTFRVDGLDLGTVPVSGGFAVFTTANLPVGTFAITAEYSGDDNFLGSTSESAEQTINQANTRTLLLTSANPSQVGQLVTFTALTSVQSPGAGTPTGTVSFYDGEELLATVDIDENGVAVFQTDALSEGDHLITAVYDGDDSFAVSLGFLLQSVVPGSGPGGSPGPGDGLPRLGAPDAVGLLKAGQPARFVQAPAHPAILEGLIRRYHQTYLGRPPEQAEIREWLDRLRSGTVEPDVIAALIGLSDDAPFA